MTFDDSSFASSESSIATYYITVDYSLTGKEKKERPERFPIALVDENHRQEQSLLASNKFFGVQDITVFKTKRDEHTKEILQLLGNPAGKVCLCDMDRVRDVNAVQRLAAAADAKALLVVHRPSESSVDLPVFSVSSDVYNKIARYESAKVSFQFYPSGRDSPDSLGAFQKGVGDSSVSPGHESLDSDAKQNIESARSERMPPQSSNDPGPEYSSGKKQIRQFDNDSVPQSVSTVDLLQMEGSWDHPLADNLEAATVEGTGQGTSLHNLRRYTVKLCTGMDPGSSEHFTTIQLSVDRVKKPIVSDASFEILLLKVVRDDKGIIHGFENDLDPRGRVCLSDLQDEGDLMMVQWFTEKLGAVALFVLTKPNAPSDLPVFVLPDIVFRNLSSSCFATAAFSVLESPLSNAAGEPQKEPTDAQFTDDIHLGKKRSYVEAARDADDKRYKPSYQSQSQSKSFAGAIWNGIVNTFGGKDHFFEPEEKKTRFSNQRAYNRSVDKIGQALDSKNEDIFKEITTDLTRFFQKKEWNFGHLVAAAYVCNMASTTGATRDLQNIVLSCIENLNLFEQKEELGLFDETHLRPPPRAVMFDFLTGRSNAWFEGANNIDRRAINILRILDSCGLLRGNFQPDLWISLSKSVDDAFFLRKKAALRRLLGSRRCQTLTLCFQGDLEKFLGAAFDQAEENGRITFEPFLSNIFLMLVEASLDSDSSDAGFLATWHASMALLDSLSFCTVSRPRTSKPEPREKVIKGLLEKASYRTRRCFTLMSQMYTSLLPDHSDYRRTLQLMEDVMVEDLRCQLDWSAMSNLLSLALAKILSSNIRLQKATDNFVRAAMNQWYSFDDKLLLLDGLFKKFVGQKWIRAVLTYKRRMTSHLDSALNEEVSPVSAVSVCLSFASENPDVFRIDDTAATNDVMTALATCVVSGKRVSAILQSPSLLTGIADSTNDDAHFYCRLLDRVHVVVRQNLVDICEAARFYISLFSGSLKPSEPLRRVAESVTASNFRKWNPTQFEDVRLQHKVVIDALFIGALDASSSRVNSGDDQLATCRALVTTLFDKWDERYSTDQVTHSCLEDVFRAVESGLWSSFEVSCNRQLPAKTSIELKLKQIGDFEENIEKSLSVVVDDRQVPLQSVLREYNCSPSITGMLCGLLHDYAYLFDGDEGDLHAHSGSKTLQDLTSDCSAASSVSSDHKQAYSICAYFLVNPSILFRESIMSMDGRNHDEFSLRKAVWDAKAWLETIFGSSSNYAGVVEALTILSKSAQDPIESEILILQKCPTFVDVTDSDVENFRVVALLFRMSKPIQRFIFCCDRMEFAVANSDDSFAELKRIVRLFYDETQETKMVDDCLIFFRSVCRILCGEATSRHSSLSDLRRTLADTLPILQLFSTISSYPELWSYANEMEWFGEEGLKRFYEEYGNVTNVLLGDSASYEMSLLDSMEPVIRVISAVGRLRGNNELLALFESIRNHEDIAAGLSGGVEGHIIQVHSRLSEIKDWFSNGVDEIAAAHSLFGAARHSGTYYIEPVNQGDSAVNVSMDVATGYALTLRFTIDTGTVQETRVLQKDALEQFIQQLSLIQNENSQTAAAMAAFVDQYRVLSSSCSNILTMQSVGYEKLLLSDFVCRAGGDYSDTATLLLKDSEMHLRSFKSWIRNTREGHPVSLLFWTDELRELHKLIETVSRHDDDDNAELYHLVEKIARIQHLCATDIGSADNHDIVRECIAARKEFPHKEPQSWLLSVSQFLTEVYNRLSPDQNENGPASRSSDIVLHSLTCTDGQEANAVCSVVANVYKDRLPWSFEILDGAVPCSMDRMTVFLERVRVFTSCRFSIVNLQKFDNQVIEKLLSFLLDRDVASSGICLHCVQRGETLIHTSPWVKGISWDQDSLQSLSTALCRWNRWILDDKAISKLVVVASNLCGTGKTRFIREAIVSSESSGGDVSQVGSISVHEQSSIASLVRSLLSKFQGVCTNRSLHVSFSFLPNRELEQHREWLEEMNHFFFSLFVLREIYDPISSKSFSLENGAWTLFVEIPESLDGATAKEWLAQNIPIVASLGVFQSPDDQYVVDHEARRVCTYLRALATGTINRKFEGGAKKRIVLVLDCSGSMQGQKFRDAVNNAVRIFDSHVVEGDEFGIILFDHHIYFPLPIQTVGATTAHLRQMIQQLPFHGGGTSMYRALSDALTMIAGRDQGIESWIVCLTDGISDSVNYQNFRHQLDASEENIHLIVVGVSLPGNYENGVREMCHKYGAGDPSKIKGFLVSSDSTTEGIDGAFDVVKSAIPVSLTFERDGALSDVDCRAYIERYLPSFVDLQDMISTSFWVRFLYRRVKVFDENHNFNYNESHDSLGSSLMQVMLLEVERLLSNEQRRDWVRTNHAQLIYDFSKADAPEFRLICTAPDELDPDLRTKLSNLDLPGFFIPKRCDLERRETLDLYLAQALDVPLQTSSDGSKFLQCIDDHNFILTLDFTMKLLSIHERVACRVPCLIEGETGVSKTALTKMYAHLRNSALSQKASARTAEELEEIERQLQMDGFGGEQGTSTLERIQKVIATNGDSGAERALNLLQEKIRRRPAYLASIPSSRSSGTSISETAIEILEQFSKSTLEQIFFELNVDSSLTEADFFEYFQEVRSMAAKLRGEAIVVAFLDEINTSSCLGLLKEVLIDNSFAGERLEDNIVVVAACNPRREQIRTSTRERDLGKDWASGHYQVAALPPSMEKLKWSFGSLTHDQEKEFIYRRIEALSGSTMSSFLQASLTEVVAESHEVIRKFAKQNILTGMQRAPNAADSDDIQMEREAHLRARSVVSLRDIQRVFALYEFFLHDDSFAKGLQDRAESEQQRRAMLLAIAVVYYLRLDSQCRREFLYLINELPTEQGQESYLFEVLNEAMTTVLDASEIPAGIAATRGLRENVFLTLVCSLSRTPLMIVGPPGSSKTLSVNLVADNANGTDSSNVYFRKRPRLSLFHYQCSKQSTSKEIFAVFQQAIQRQERVDEAKHLCCVFMDEAGLPEEEKESLKVLHYLLEGHMSSKAKVGFVAISNHILDAAKSNRCITLLRQEPDEEEMASIVSGVLFDFRDDGRSCIHDVEVGGVLVPAQDFASKLCEAYTLLTRDHGSLSHLATFFGLRDFIFFLKAVRIGSTVRSARLHTSLDVIIHAIERNFNGVEADELRQVAGCFLKPLASLKLSWTSDMVEASFRSQMIVLKDALTRSASHVQHLNRPRFKLVIDCTEDDSILRLLRIGGVAEVTKRSLYKLSNLPDEEVLERLRVISGVKYAALQGIFAVLSQTESINESFYDLFNQRFREVGGRDGSVSLYANIACGGLSRRSLVSDSFECVVHVRESNMLEIPAPFLNRFEKYRLTLEDVSLSSWSKFGSVANIVERAKTRTSVIAQLLGDANESFAWMGSKETLDSIFLEMLPNLDARIWDGDFDRLEQKEDYSVSSSTFKAALNDFIEHITSIRGISEHIDQVLDAACCVLPVNVVGALEQLLRDDSKQRALQDSLRSLLTNSPNETVITELFSALTQMVLTRSAVFRLIQLATPESIFVNCKSLPTDVLQEYFRQEHFSLKRLLHQVSTANSQSLALVVIHVRSDQFVHGIPTLSVDRTSSLELNDSMDKVKRLVHDRPDTLVIEHLARLRSESLVRGAIEAWADDDSKSIFLLLVDMSHENSLDRANYIRMCVEQHTSENTRKTFALLLHYSPSSSIQSTCYPALFLGDWDHVFLDSVGNDRFAFEVDQFIKLACQENIREEGVDRFDQNEAVPMRDSIVALLPRVLPHVASQKFLYRDQNLLENESFYHRKAVLDKILLSRVADSSTIGDILCDKFCSLWFDTALLRTTQSASEALLCGRTKLSLSMSIHSVLIQTLQFFLASTLAEVNQWMNFDLIVDSSRDVVADLFGVILKKLPTLPFEELVLQSKQGSATRLRPCPPSRVDNAEVRFPFFCLISEYLDELVGNIQESFSNLQQSGDAFDVDALSVEECIRRAMESIEGVESVSVEDNDALWFNQDRSELLRAVLAFLESNARLDLFQGYLQQFLEWKVGCKANEFILQWWQSHAHGNIVAIHVIWRLKRTDCMHMASIVSLMKSLPPDLLLTNESASPNLIEAIFDSFTCAILDSRIPDKVEMRFLLSILAQRDPCWGVGDEKAACLLRLVHLAFLLEKAGAPMASLRSHLLDTEMSYCKTQYTLDQCFHIAKANDEEASEPLEFVLKNFLSPAYIRVSSTFRKDDLSFVLQCIDEGKLAGTRHHLAVGLLRSLCESDSADNVLGFSAGSLLQINEKLSCENLSIFTPDGNRTCLPHFIPEWLRNESVPSTAEITDVPVYLADYKHAFAGHLPTIVYDLILSTLAKEAEQMNSEQLFLQISRQLEQETSLKRQAHTQLSRLRAVGHSRDLRGTALASLVLSARLVCFVAKVAFEVATALDSHVFSGLYSREANALLDCLMSVKQASWQMFFMSSILRHRGEGTLSAALTTDGPLGDMSWCVAWSQGLPMSRNGAAESLQEAETALADAMAEEERKSREMRRCPHCGKEFIVAQRNCGQFTCGSDAHLVRGQPQVAGAVIGAGHGCLRAFNLDQAPRYEADETILQPLRARIEEVRSQLERCQRGTELWDAAGSFSIPAIVVCVERKENGGPIVPHATCLGLPANDEQNEIMSLIRVLWEAADLGPRMSLLPDLIELYLWINETFRFLCTKERAFEIRLGNVMKQEQLQKRFDSARVHRVLALWDRVRHSLNPILAEMNQIVHWQCDEVSIPFDRIENARLISLLSEGAHPTDGNDFLFLIISETIDLYNNYARKLSRFSESPEEMSDADMESLQPQFIMRGCRESMTVEDFEPLSKDTLQFIVESCFNLETGAFEPEAMKCMLQDEMNLHDSPPQILSAMNLREKFCFRDDEEPQPGQSATESSIVLEDGMYFANSQDSQLMSGVRQRLDAYGESTGDNSIRRTLIDNFHSTPYDNIRAMLEGCRNFLDILLNENQVSFDSIGSSLQTLSTQRKDSTPPSGVLETIGFLDLTDAQAKLISSFGFAQLVELVNYSGYQLASEGYLFTKLPLFMSDPLTGDDANAIKAAIGILGNERGVPKTRRLVDEFVCDVLRFYESEIVSGVAKANMPLRTFLSSFCDSSDPVFQLIPATVTLRHYVSLRQLLHQMKLSMICHASSSDSDARGKDLSMDLKTIRRGRCWLWEDDDFAVCNEKAEASGNGHVDASRNRWKLWFDEVLPTSTVGSDDTSVAVEDDMETDDLVEPSQRSNDATANASVKDQQHSPECSITRAARLLQRWWRHQLKLLDVVMDDMDEEELGPMGYGDDDLDGMDVDLEDEYGDVRAKEAASISSIRSESVTSRGVTIESTYGTPAEELKMRKWLDEHSLPQCVGDAFLKLGARTLADVIMLVRDFPELVDDFAPLDLIKLKRATAAAQTTGRNAGGHV